MRIAFVGKGGSGKSTMSSLFITYLHHKVGAEVLALDADLNMNLAGLLGVNFPAEKYLSDLKNAAEFRKFLKGGNALIRDENAFLPTTPPGPGSNLITSVVDKNLDPYAVLVKQSPALNLVTVGTYVAEEIGQACYHTNLFAVENLLTHLDLPKDNCVVADMVAGTDAFSYSLHLQFDAIILIAEPTPESAEVCRLYFGLAKEAGIEKLVHIIANKVEDADDLEFIRNVTGREPLGVVPSMPSLRKFRQKGGSVTADLLTDNLAALFEKVMAAATHADPDEKARFAMLRDLHYKLCSQYWVISGYGEDVAGQYGDTPPIRKAS
jgi:CO dehydrogenase maturation factor